MAYYDENGRITIDEVAAEKDLKNLSVAMEHFLTAKEYLNQIISVASTFSGKTANAIDEQARMLLSQLESIINTDDELAEQIKSAVDKYKKIDSNLKNIMG